MKAKFTPGPWEIQEDPLVDEITIQVKDQLPGYVEICTVGQGMDDARLIAAAPDLYDALLAVITPEHDGGRPVLVEGECSEFDSVLAKVRAALAKAVPPCP